jgi:hypothetical protein
MVTLGPSNVRDHLGSITYVARLLQNARDGFEGRAQRRRVADLDDVLEFLQLKDQLFKTIMVAHEQYHLAARAVFDGDANDRIEIEAAP